ncbi:MAG: YCF48-related protein, partial [Bacteroidia bacterium]|nr:YCF48-related protein [Bacteroidia bacterium]
MKTLLNTSIKLIYLVLSFTFLNKEIKAQCGIKAGSNDSILVCGESTNLFIQTDWQLIPTVAMQKLRSISLIQKDILFVGADSGKVYKTINGGNSFFQINSPNTNGSIRDIWFFNQQSGLVFTDSAKIFKTSNGGNNWQEIYYPLTIPDSSYTWTQRVFNSVTFITENIGFVGGLIYSPSGIQGAIFYKTTNAGNTWTPVALPNIKGIEKVYFTDTATGYICSNGSILKTTNGGQTWVSIFNLQNASMKDICFINKDTGFAASNSILRTFDGGTTWTTINSPSLFARGIKTDQTNSLYVFYSGAIYKSVDLGNTWLKININASLGQYSHYIEAISFTYQHPGIAIGFDNNLNNGFVLKMDQIDSVLWVADNGLIDTLSTNPKVRPNFSTTYFVTAWMGGCSSFSDVTVLVNPLEINLKLLHTVSCGDSLQILTTSNINDENLYTYQWQPSTYLLGSNQIKPIALIKTNTNYKLTVSSNNGCMDTAITQVNLNFSINAGEDINLKCGTQKELAINQAGWSKQTITLEPPIITNLNEIIDAGSDTIYLLGGRKIWQSDKNGINWRPVYNISGLNAGLWVNRAHFTTPQIGYVSAFDDGPMQGAILKTTNGGNTWQTVNVGNFQLGGVYFTSNQTGYIAASPSKILKTTNAGNNWLAVNVPTTNGLSEIFFPSNTIGYAAGNNGAIIKTINSGNSWSNLITPITRQIRALYFTSIDTGFIGTYDTIWKTTNGGISWTPFPLDNEYSRSFYITDFAFVNAQHGYASAELYNMFPSYEGGAIFETKNGGLSWERMMADSSEKLKSLYVNNKGNGMAIGGNNHFIYKDIEPQNYLWSPSIGLNNPNLRSPIANPTQTTLYSVTANINECFATDSVLVSVSKFMNPS